MKNFSVKSCWKTFKWIVASERSRLLSMSVGIMLGFFFCEEGVMLPTALGNNTNPGIWYMAMAFCIFIILAWMMYGASQMFAALSKKQSAITLLMHPATNLEKFVARWFYCTVFWGLATLAAFVVGDALRYGFNMAMGWKGADTDMPLFFRLIGSWGDADWTSLWAKGNQKFVWFALCFAMMSVLHHSIYILGSIVFRRHRFIITSVFLVIASTALTFYGIGPADFMEPDLTQHGTGVYAALFFVLLAITVFCYIAAYKLFRRSQVISNKWFNI